MIGNPYPQFQNVQQWNDFVNEVRNALAAMDKTITTLYEDIDAGGEYVVPDATSTIKGIMKLYPSTGNNTDGTITQRALTVSQQEQDARISGIYATKEELASYPTKTEMADAISEIYASDAEIADILEEYLPAQGLNQ